MSITSVGASFGYIDPASLAGPTQSAQQSSDTDQTPAASPAANASQTTPPPQPPQAIAADGPKFAAQTMTVLVAIQEKATAA